MIKTIVAVAVSALWMAGMSPAVAQSAARCPPGQIWRVSKKVCQPKADNMHLFGGKAAKPKAETPKAEAAPVAAKPAAEKPAPVKPAAVSSAKPAPAPPSPPETAGVDREPVGTIRPRAEAPAPRDAPVPDDAPPLAALVPTPAPRPDDLAAPAAPAPEVAVSAPEVAVSVPEPPPEAARPARELPPIVRTGLYGDEQRVYRLVKAITLPTEDLGHSLAPGEILADAVRLRPLPEGAERELSMFRDLRLQYVFANGSVALVLPASRMVLRVIAQDGVAQGSGGRD